MLESNSHSVNFRPALLAFFMAARWLMASKLVELALQKAVLVALFGYKKKRCFLNTQVNFSAGNLFFAWLKCAHQLSTAVVKNTIINKNVVVLANNNG